jgi:hypothetical protein
MNDSATAVGEAASLPTAGAFALAIASLAACGWSVFGSAGLVGAIEERANHTSGSGWFVLGALLFQSPCALATLLLVVASSVRWARGRPGSGLAMGASLAAVGAQIAVWYVVASLNTSGTC